MSNPKTYHKSLTCHQLVLEPKLMKNAAAFFDMDHTLIWENAGYSSARFNRRLGIMSKTEMLKGLFRIALYRMALLDVTDWYEDNIAKIAGARVDDMLEYGQSWFAAEVRKSLYQEAVDLIEMHRREGHILAVLSNSPEFFVKPLAANLGIPHTICSRLETADGSYTGKVIKPLCYGQGKRDYAIQWAAANNIDLSASFFYTDSHFDLEVMQIIGHPVATNPDFKLRREARRNGWEIRDFKKIAAA